LTATRPEGALEEQTSDSGRLGAFVKNVTLLMRERLLVIAVSDDQTAPM